MRRGGWGAVEIPPLLSVWWRKWRNRPVAEPLVRIYDVLGPCFSSELNCPQLTITADLTSCHGSATVMKKGPKRNRGVEIKPPEGQRSEVNHVDGDSWADVNI